MKCLQYKCININRQIFVESSLNNRKDWMHRVLMSFRNFSSLNLSRTVVSQPTEVCTTPNPVAWQGCKLWVCCPLKRHSLHVLLLLMDFSRSRFKSVHQKHCGPINKTNDTLVVQLETVLYCCSFHLAYEDVDVLNPGRRATPYSILQLETIYVISQSKETPLCLTLRWASDRISDAKTSSQLIWGFGHDEPRLCGALLSDMFSNQKSHAKVCCTCFKIPKNDNFRTKLCSIGLPMTLMRSVIHMEHKKDLNS